jgi:hypothetical protein
VFLSLNFHFKIASYEKPILLALIIQTVSWAQVSTATLQQSLETKKQLKINRYFKGYTRKCGSNSNEWTWLMAVNPENQLNFM